MNITPFTSGQLWDLFVEAKVDLFATRVKTYCPHSSLQLTTTQPFPSEDSGQGATNLLRGQFHQLPPGQSADFWLVSDTQCFYSVLRKSQSVTETGGVNLAVYLGDWLLLVQSTQEVTTQMSDFKMQSELHNKHRKVCTTCTFSGFMPELNHLYSLSVMRVKVFRAWTVPSVTEAGDANQRKDKSKFSHFLLLILFTSMGEFSACYSQCVRGTKLTVFFQKLFCSR